MNSFKDLFYKTPWAKLNARGLRGSANEGDKEVRANSVSSNGKLTKTRASCNVHLGKTLDNSKSASHKSQLEKVESELDEGENITPKVHPFVLDVVLAFAVVNAQGPSCFTYGPLISHLQETVVVWETKKNQKI